MTSNLIYLGSRIVKRREQLKYTQKDMAELTGLSNKTIQAIEKGKSGVSISNWILVAGILGLELSLQGKRMSDETGKSF
ncbi:helix-turn-helix domain-containing protein [Rhizosphaericola mali]|uniref:Helix-turn-helix transcriptional regulator n=1 Tax=Rhizosphaericola mali TaxID=2545455 RepID=A0A5P2GFA1_9BACT|nr:helix-turn-helix transcriptional regulator [Rhizosphaericola mali]QES90291.1 helix-turn-helix transcriptional regulator [Rhizosphaericola mali]